MRRPLIALLCLSLIGAGIAAVLLGQRFGYIPKNIVEGYAKRVDVVLQAGHEGTTNGRTGASGQWGNEIDWTPIVADTAAEILRQSGFAVRRVDANIWRQGRINTQLALFLHFDGSSRPCASGASIGYDDPSDAPAAEAWKALYSKQWPFKWMPDNFTHNLKGYYGFRYTHTSDAELVLEFGEISCKQQAVWMKKRLHLLGRTVAEFAQQRVCGKKPAHPGCASAILAGKQADKDPAPFVLEPAKPPLIRL